MMKKNTCPHCGAWGQLSKFCNQCGKSIIYASIEKGNSEFLTKPIAPSTQNKDVPVIVFFAIILVISVSILLDFL